MCTREKRRLEERNYKTGIPLFTFLHLSLPFSSSLPTGRFQTTSDMIWREKVFQTPDHMISFDKQTRVVMIINYCFQSPFTPSHPLSKPTSLSSLLLASIGFARNSNSSVDKKRSPV